jgi:UDPglucose--hexose-1-phosphate uridylyltransferase
MDVDQVLSVVDAWTDVYRGYTEDRPNVNYVQIFENKGEMMGCSNPHPHGQVRSLIGGWLMMKVWATEQVPEEPAKEMQGMRAYRLEQSEKGRANACLLCDYAKAEEEKAVRVVCQNASFIAVVPWWAVVRLCLVAFLIRAVAVRNARAGKRPFTPLVGFRQ